MRRLTSIGSDEPVPFNFSPNEEARWLAKLAVAITQAQKVVWRIGVSEGDSAEAKDLYCRLEAVRAEGEALRRGPSPAPKRETRSYWRHFLSENRNFDPPAQVPSGRAPPPANGPGEG